MTIIKITNMIMTIIKITNMIMTIIKITNMIMTIIKITNMITTILINEIIIFIKYQGQTTNSIEQGRRRRYSD